MGVISKQFSRIEVVMAASHCERHQAQVNEPCWYLPIRNGKDTAPAVCGRRVKRAGFTGGVSAASVRQTPSAKLQVRTKA